MTRTLAILTLRNEGAFLLEWLAHHRAVGFTDFLVFSNDCEDGTDAMLDRLADMGELTHVPNPAPHARGPQWEALAQAVDHPLYAAADWAMVLDIDEFVNVHAGDHTLDALRAALPQADAIALTWRLFGNNGLVQFTDAPLTDQFTRAAPKVITYPWRAVMIKSLFRTDGPWDKLGVHRPRGGDKAAREAARWYSGAGDELEGPFKHQRLFSHLDRDNYRLAQLNHYPLGAMQSYLLKVARGRANREDGAMGMDYWVERNWATDEDTTIARYTPARDPIWARLAADSTLADLHARAVAWRHDQFNALMLQDDFRALFGRLIITPPARQTPPQLAAYIFDFARKAQQSGE